MPLPASLAHTQKVKRNIIARAQMLRELRCFFHQENFLEVETPILVPQPECEIHIEPFVTTFSPEDPLLASQSCYLITSPEYAMKKLLAAGFDKIYQITKVFRNGEHLGVHNPEFTMLEWYRAQTDYEWILKDFERLLPALALHFHQGPVSKWKDGNFLWQPPYERISLRKAFRQFAQSELHGNIDGETFTRILVEKVEPNLPQDRPFFLVDFPASQAALAKRKKDDPNFADRFELYLGPLEVANGFSELTDSEEQRKRFQEHQSLRSRLGKKNYPLSEDFLSTLASGLPQSAGVALGLDRLLMILTGSPTLADVLSFPFEYNLP